MFPLSPSHSLSPTSSQTGSSRRMQFNSPTPGSSRRSLLFFASSDSASSAALSVTPEEKEKIFKWIMSDECKTRDDLNKYKEPDFTVASRMFDLCKSTELDCIFTEYRKTIDARKLCILAFAHSETTFVSVNEAENYLRGSKRNLLNPSKGSFGSLKLSVNDVTIYSFVMSDACKTEADIDQKFTLRDEIDKARAMFEVAKDLSPGNMFIEARSKWTDEQLSFVAKEHANRPFLTIENADNYLVLVEKKGISYRSFSNYLPVPAPSQETSEPSSSVTVKPSYMY